MCFSVNGYFCLVCCVFSSVYELFSKIIRKCLGVVAILWLNVMEVMCVGGGALLVFQRMCVLCL